MPPQEDLQTVAPPEVDDLSGAMPEGMPPEEYDDEYGGAIGRRFAKRYMMGDEPDLTGATEYMKGMESGDRGMMDHYMKYMCSDKNTKDFYAKACGTSPDHYSKASPTAMRYRKERDEFSQKYQKAERERQQAVTELEEVKQEFEDTKQELEDRTGEARISNRKATLYQKSMQGVTFDLNKELDRVAEMGADEWDRHLQTMDNYPRVPTGDFLPIDNEIQGPPKPSAKEEASAKYSKRASDIVMQYRKKPWSRELDHVKVTNYLVDNGHGDFDLEKFDKA